MALNLQCSSESQGQGNMLENMTQNRLFCSCLSSFCNNLGSKFFLKSLLNIYAYHHKVFHAEVSRHFHDSVSLTLTV